MLSITPLYTALLTLLFVVFSALVIRCRLKCNQVIGDGGKDIMVRHMRAHANFSEYIPLALLLMLMLELGGTNSTTLHIMGIALIVGRISHFYSLTVKEPSSAKSGKMVIIYRQIGMVLTFGCLLAGAITAINNYF